NTAYRVPSALVLDQGSMVRLFSILGAVLVAGAAASLSACGGGAAPGSVPPVTSKGVESPYDMPSSIEGGLTKIDYANAGSDYHEWALAKIDPGHTAADLKAYLAKAGPHPPPPPWVAGGGGVGVMSPGQQIGVTRDLQPGSYAFICFLPGPGGKPHYALGMFKGFDVSGDSGADAPQTAGSNTGTAKGFQVSKLASGEQTIARRNDIKQPVGFSLFEQKPGHQLQELRSFFQQGDLSKE